jgi:hypothetical protein
VKGSLQNTTTNSLSDPIPPDFYFCVPKSQKCSKSSSSSSSFSSSSSNSSFGDDYQKSLSNGIPLDFCFCVLESQNAPNLLHMFLFCGTT